jgi:hypothetical protein
MTLEVVYELINQASRAEVLSNTYQRSLATQLDSFHRSISLDGHDPASDLCNFVLKYISIAPQIIECIDECAKLSGIYTLFQPSIDLALRYFVHPSDFVLQHSPIKSLLIRAYQCHRLIEELYENNRTLRNKHIHNIQTTQANLLAHHLIGEQLANEIDNTIYAAFQQLVSMPDYYYLNLEPFLNTSNDTRWQLLKEDWLSLLEKHNITLNLLAGHQN